MAEPKTLLSVHETRGVIWLRWSDELAFALEAVDDQGERTDKIIDMIEELRAESADTLLDAEYGDAGKFMRGGER